MDIMRKKQGGCRAGKRQTMKICIRRRSWLCPTTIGCAHSFPRLALITGILTCRTTSARPKTTNYGCKRQNISAKFPKEEKPVLIKEINKHSGFTHRHWAPSVNFTLKCFYASSMNGTWGTGRSSKISQEWECSRATVWSVCAWQIIVQGRLKSQIKLNNRNKESWASFSACFRSI